MSSPTDIKPDGTSMIDRVAMSFADDLERLAQATAAEQGQPVGTRSMSDAEALKQWGIVDPKVNYDQILGMLQPTGLPPEMLDPEQGLMVFQEQPDLAQWYGQPVQDPALAQRMAVLAEYPFRMGLLMDIDDPDEQVRESDRLHRLWERELIGSLDVPVPIATPPSAPVVQAQPAPLMPPQMIGG